VPYKTLLYLFIRGIAAGEFCIYLSVALLQMSLLL